MYYIHTDSDSLTIRHIIPDFLCHTASYKKIFPVDCEPG